MAAAVDGSIEAGAGAVVVVVVVGGVVVVVVVVVDGVVAVVPCCSDHATHFVVLARHVAPSGACLLEQGDLGP